jgi:hypothetical protein
MNDSLTVIEIVIAITLFVHFYLLMMHNAFRVKKLLTYIDQFKQEGKLSKNDFELLYNRYTSFFHYLEFYPDKSDFKVLYENTAFDAYVKKSKWKLKYYSIVSLTLIVILLILDSFDK